MHNSRSGDLLRKGGGVELRNSSIRTDDEGERQCPVPHPCDFFLSQGPDTTINVRQV